MCAVGHPLRERASKGGNLSVWRAEESERKSKDPSAIV